MNKNNKYIIYLMVCVLLLGIGCPSVMGSTSRLNKKIRMVTDIWPPYYGPSLDNQGFLINLTRKIFEDSGYLVEVDFMDWDKAVQLSMNGEYDGLIGGYYQEDRTNFYKYSMPVFAINIVFIAKKTSKAHFEGDLEALKGLRIGVSKGYIYSDAFDNAKYLKKIGYSGPEELVEKLLTGEVEVIAIAEKVGRYILEAKKKSNINKVKILKTNLNYRKIYILISNKHPNCIELIDAFNKGLKKMALKGKLSEMLP